MCSNNSRISYATFVRPSCIRYLFHDFQTFRSLFYSSNEHSRQLALSLAPVLLFHPFTLSSSVVTFLQYEPAVVGIAGCRRLCRSRFYPIEHVLAALNPLYLVRPWLDTPPNTDDEEIFDEETDDDSLSLP